MPITESKQRRSTKQREIVLKAVVASRKHPTAEEVHALSRRRLPAISLATVYRNLRLLVEDGFIREVQFHGDVLRYDGMLEEHEHFYCRSCGTVVDLPQTLPVKSLQSVREKVGGGAIERYALDYYGLCTKCNSSR